MGLMCLPCGPDKKENKVLNTPSPEKKIPGFFFMNK
jgi:hypothetical protein